MKITPGLSVTRVFWAATGVTVPAAPFRQGFTVRLRDAPMIIFADARRDPDSRAR